MGVALDIEAAGEDEQIAIAAVEQEFLISGNEAADAETGNELKRF